MLLNAFFKMEVPHILLW